MSRESRRGERYYRSITANVLQRYFELEDGVVGPERGLRGSGERAFDPRVLNYRLDVERIVKRVQPCDVVLMTAIHRDGLTAAAAAKCAGLLVKRPDDYVMRLEVALGKAFERAKMTDLSVYLS